MSSQHKPKSFSYKGPPGVTMPRPRRKKRPTAHDAFIEEACDDAEELLPLSDEDETQQTKKPQPKIIALDGQLGFSHKRKGFDSRTNFTLDVYGDIFSVEYQLKGLIYHLFFLSKFTASSTGSIFKLKMSYGECLYCYIPEKCILKPASFKVNHLKRLTYSNHWVIVTYRNGLTSSISIKGLHWIFLNLLGPSSFKICWIVLVQVQTTNKWSL